LEAFSPQKRTPLHLAITEGHIDVVQYLVEKHYADTEKKDENGQTTLHMAVEEGCFNIVQYLVEEKGVNLEARDNHGQTALHYASKLGKWVTTDLLLSNNADAFARDNAGNTPLHLASDSAVARSFIEWCESKGEKPSIERARMLFTTNKKGQKPYELVVEVMENVEDLSDQEEYRSVVEYLKSYLFPLAVPTGLRENQIFHQNQSVMLNPELDWSKRKIAEELLSTIEDTSVHEVALNIIGFICVSDVLNEN